ncbi:MAG: LPS export ABC transporter ATP-binding protein [Gemmatimonadales bacterium]
MTHALLPQSQDQNPSVPLALAAFLRVADLTGAAGFGALAVAYREQHLELSGRVGLGGGGERGALSVDQVRRYLESSVLPRLVTDGILEPIPTDLLDATQLRMRHDAWSAVVAGREVVRNDLVRVAAERLAAAEALGRAAPSAAGSTLVARGLTKAYRRRKVVDDVDVDLNQGEIVGLLGPNGAGKTTIFYMIVGLIRPDAGRISIDGNDISALPMYRRARRGIGYLAQEPSVFRRLTVEENVLAILETLPIGRQEQERRLESLLDELSIKHLRAVPAFKLSGGERRRLEITRALVTAPKFMLLDEPFAGVDPIAVHDIQTIVASLRHRGIGVLITDHNVEQTLDIVDRAYIVFEGKVQVSGSVRDLVFDERVADLYFGPTLTARLRERLGAAA